MVTPVAKREAVARLRSAFEVSERRACSALGVDRTLVRYRSARPDDIDLRTRLRELAAQRRRFGYRRLHILMIREGLCMNHKKLRRLYREEGLQVRRRGGHKRALGTRAPIALRQGPNQRWSLDFQSDALADGRRFRIFAVVDDFTRECLALIADTSLSSLRVVRELDAIVAVRGRPAMCVSDNGTELTSRAGLRWSQETQVEWHYIAPGKPQQNAFAESFFGRLRDPERDAVHVTGPRLRRPFAVEGRLQHGATPQRSRQSLAGRLRQSPRSRNATGRGAALRGLRAPSRCFAEPTRLKSTQDSTHRWMKLGAQVTLIAVRQVRANYEHPHRSISAHRSVHFRTFQACFRPR
jgi:putative transposase